MKKILNFHEWEIIRKKPLNEANRFLEQIYQAGISDCKQAIGADDADIYVWDEEKLYNVLRQYHISRTRCQQIIEELEGDG